MLVSTCCSANIEVVCCVSGDYYACIRCGRVTKVKILGEKRMLSSQNFYQLQKWVGNDEGLGLLPYDDFLGNPTIGFGINLKWGLTVDECVVLMQLRLNKILVTLFKQFPSFINLSPNRQMALANMAYQMGVGGLLNFTDMTTALKNNNFTTASRCALESDWARRFKDRAERIAHTLETDILITDTFKMHIPEINLGTLLSHA